MKQGFIGRSDFDHFQGTEFAARTRAGTAPAVERLPAFGA
jgi:hypothetical protein